MNETNKAQRVLLICAVITVAVGTMNAYLKHKRPPTARFLIGSGVAYFLLSALSEVEPDIAKGLGTGVMTTVLLSGDASGLLSYIDTGEFDTSAKKKPSAPTRNTHQRERSSAVQTTQTAPNTKQYRSDTVAATPGLPKR
jgi:hypothetical protein